MKAGVMNAIPLGNVCLGMAQSTGLCCLPVPEAVLTEPQPSPQGWGRALSAHTCPLSPSVQVCSQPCPQGQAPLPVGSSRSALDPAHLHPSPPATCPSKNEGMLKPKYSPQPSRPKLVSSHSLCPLNPPTSLPTSSPTPTPAIDIQGGSLGA